MNLAELKHEDGCRYWDDSKFCSCGAKEYEQLRQTRQKLRALVKKWMARDSFQTAERFNGYAGYWKMAAEELEAILQSNAPANRRFCRPEET